VSFAEKSSFEHPSEEARAARDEIVRHVSMIRTA
jgi:hypothetical protein